MKITADETIFNAANSVYRDPYLSRSVATAVQDALAAAGYALATDSDKERALSSCEEDLGMLRGRIITAIIESPFDFRTAESLSKQLGVPDDILTAELSRMEATGLLRRPIVADAKYDTWYRDVRRGLTWQEKWHRWAAIITFKPLRSD